MDLQAWKLEKGLRDIRRRRRNLGLAFIGILPYFYVTGILARAVGLPPFAPLLPYAVYIIFGYARLVVAECPRCGNRFFSGLRGYNYLSGSCLNCGQML